MIPSFTTIKELVDKLARKEVTPTEITQHYVQRIKQHDPSLQSILEIFEPTNDITGNLQGPLAGIPFVVKDNICQKGKLATAGSCILKNYRASYNATVINKLHSAGAYSIGRANCDEFAMGSSGETSAWGPTRNPWNIDHVPGGSSSGSAAAVAAGLIPFAIGTETGGSVRQPASFCGLVGMYPTYGRNSRYGLMAMTSSFDQAGALTKTVYDNALVMSCLSGQDSNDSTTIPLPAQDFTANLDGKIPQGIKIGIIKDGIAASIDPEVAAAFERAYKQLEALGAKISIIDLPSLKHGNAAYFILSRAQIASNLSRYDGSLYGNRIKQAESLEQMYEKTRWEGFGQEVKTRILTGNFVLSAGHKDAYYNKALHVRSMINAEFEATFADVDLLISPTVPTLPFKLGQFSGDPVSMYLADCFTVVNCVIGTPALSIPCGYSKSGLPIGFQFLGPRLSEALLYKVAYAFEQNNDYHLNHPKAYE
ncbi:MAG: Glutamyl-tRNA(Gln) amidotransferase subunit A [candidate division TM6 bacterium GW2011_GWF2_38_10]|nr:MAG: Glutamyl-tRNA(Gln) amidotransferase subunit A [candidate division TM6 bacterium GW2011_GWF2_38_10]